ncbi:MAG: acyltransferase family protein [Actinomycetota bacterium]|nr:acyltransferase family protein [Actinomycetota bacterium]
MATTTLADQAKHNGSGEADAATGNGRGRTVAGPLGSLLGDAVGAVGAQIAKRLAADLDDRDPDYIRDNLPLVWLLSSFYFRGEVRNLGNVPEDRAVLLVGNHSGGNVTPDTLLFTLAFSTYFGVERPFYQLAHSLVLASPWGQLLRKYGTVTASPENAERALSSGAALLVYPGGDREVHRPAWERNKVDFGGRHGFVRLALEQDVPIVPVVSVGGQETALFLSRGAGLAKALGLDRLLRLKALPISIAAPWGLNVGDLMGHIPLPAKITTEVLPPIDLRRQFGPDPDVDEVYEQVTRQMQEALDALAAERRFPVIG